MIMDSSNDNFSGSGGKGDHRVVTLVQGRVHLTLFSNSRFLFVALRVVVPDHWPTAPSPRALLEHVPTPAVKETLRGFIAWGDIPDSTTQDVTSPYWKRARAMKTISSYPTLVVLHEVFMTVLRGIIPERGSRNGNGTIESFREPSLTSLDQETAHVPRIIVTPPDEPSSASFNAVPVPQDAAFGNQLLVPDPDFRVINRHSAEDPFSDDYRAIESHSDPSTHGDSEAYARDTDGMEASSEIIGSGPFNDYTDDEGVTALGLGPTWSG